MVSSIKEGMIGKRLATLLAAALLPCAALAAAESMLITPDQAVDMALRNNLGLESARVGASTARRASDLAWNQFIPSVDIAGTLRRGNNALSIPGQMMVDTTTGMVVPVPIPPGTLRDMHWMMIGTLSANLSFNISMLEDMNRLRLEYEMGMISYGKARAQLERDVRKAYHNILLLQENIALLRGSLENADRQVAMAQANFNAGLAPELTLLQAQVARENMRPIIDQAEGGLRLLLMQFSMFLGLPAETEFELAPVTTDMAAISLDTAELIRRAADGQPDVRELRQSILIMNSLRRSGRQMLFTPMLSLGWNADPTFVGNPFADNSWFDGIGSGDNWNQNSGGLTFTLGFRLNGLLPFGAERQGLAALDDGIRIANIGLAQMIRGTEIEINNIVLTLDRIRITMDALGQTVTLAERSFELTMQAYAAGLVDLFQVQNAEQSLRQARVQLHEQQFDYLNGLLDLEYALGVPFGSLTAAGAPAGSI